MANLDKLEARVAEDRAALSKTIDNLTETVAPDRVGADLQATLETYGNAVSEKIMRTARDNPAALAVTGLGLALLATGPGPRPRPEPSAPQAVAPEEALMGFDARVARADAEIKQEMSGMMEDRPTASRLSAALDQGLEKLPRDAQKRVRSARKAAIEAQDAVDRQIRRAARKSKGFVNDQPLAAGALALGFGALIGALLPNTRREDALLGERRDALMRQASSVLNEELDKLHGAAQQALADRTRSNGAVPHGR